MGKLTGDHDTIHGGKQSLLAVALKESQDIDGTKNWGFPEAEDHIKHTVLALALQNRSGILHAREPGAIIDMYSTHIWKEELTLEDKWEFAKALLTDTRSVLWNDIPVGFHKEIAQAVENGGEVSPACMENVIQWLDLESRFVLRCETIRDDFSPEGLLKKSR